MAYDLVIQGGTVVDGTGNPGFNADVALKGGRIVAIGKRLGESAASIDAGGRVVAPGFIDIHSHSDIAVLTHPPCESFLAQGVTTIVNGNCGHSLAPYIDSRDRADSRMGKSAEETKAGFSLPEDKSWTSFGEYLAAVESAKPSLNVASLVGHNRIREAVMGHRQDAASHQEMRDMQRLLRDSLDDGAVGMSTGLVFSPGMYASTDEIAKLATVLVPRNRLYASHMREGALVDLGGPKEAIEIGHKAGCRIQMSHSSPGRAHLWGKSDQLLEMIVAARAGGVEVLGDVVPYVRGSSGLTRLVPPWLQSAGTEALIEALSNPERRAELRKQIMDRSTPDWGSTSYNCRWGYWNHTPIEPTPGSDGKWRTLAEIAKDRNADPLEVAFDLLLENPETRCQNVCFNEIDHRRLLASGFYTVEVDAIAQPLNVSTDHPRTYAGFPAVFRKYVRGESVDGMPEDVGAHVFSLEHAVKVMTSLPAQIMGAFDRGTLRLGSWADIVIFDPSTIRDTATYESPTQAPAGIDHVIVNGEVVFAHGSHTGARPGKVLRAGRDIA